MSFILEEMTRYDSIPSDIGILSFNDVMSARPYGLQGHREDGFAHMYTCMPTMCGGDGVLLIKFADSSPASPQMRKLSERALPHMTNASRVNSVRTRPTIRDVLRDVASDQEPIWNTVLGSDEWGSSADAPLGYVLFRAVGPWTQQELDEARAESLRMLTDVNGCDPCTTRRTDIMPGVWLISNRLDEARDVELHRAVGKSWERLLQADPSLLGMYSVRPEDRGICYYSGGKYDVEVCSNVYMAAAGPEVSGLSRDDRCVPTEGEGGDCWLSLVAELIYKRLFENPANVDHMYMTDNLEGLRDIGDNSERPWITGTAGTIVYILRNAEKILAKVEVLCGGSHSIRLQPWPIASNPNEMHHDIVGLSIVKEEV